MLLSDAELKRFFLKVDVPSDSADCWVWTKATNNGYGIIWLHGRTQRAHRVAYEHFVGPIPSDKVLHHICENRPCVNPAHLTPIDDTENTALGNSPAAINSRKTHCPRGHKYDATYKKSYHRGTGERTVRYCTVCNTNREVI